MVKVRIHGMSSSFSAQDAAPTPKIDKRTRIALTRLPSHAFLALNLFMGAVL